jgi:hypothetical protein
MSNDWKIKETLGGETGILLDGCEIRLNKEGDAYELIAVLAKTPGKELPIAPFEFPPFAFRGLIWTVGVQTFEGTDDDTVIGPWVNNFQPRHPSPVGDESGTYTGQSGPGTGEEGKEDAASASA